MPKFAVVSPVLPGHQARDVPDSVFAGRLDEYEGSRHRLGFTMERVYDMPTPMGNFAIAYIEADNDFETTFRDMFTSDLQVDKDFAAALKEVHGFDPAVAGNVPPPEVVAEWWDETAPARGRGLAFVAPLLPGKVEAGRAFVEEAYVTRRDELTARRRAQGLNGEVVILQAGTPGGDMLVVYLEGNDPAESNRRFAASTEGYDAWFKDQLKAFVPPFVDFNTPLPPITEFWDWRRTPVVA